MENNKGVNSLTLTSIGVVTVKILRELVMHNNMHEVYSTLDTQYTQPHRHCVPAHHCVVVTGGWWEDHSLCTRTEKQCLVLK